MKISYHQNCEGGYHEGIGVFYKCNCEDGFASFIIIQNEKASSMF